MAVPTAIRRNTYREGTMHSDKLTNSRRWSLVDLLCQCPATYLIRGGSENSSFARRFFDWVWRLGKGGFLTKPMNTNGQRRSLHAREGFVSLSDVRSGERSVHTLTEGTCWPFRFDASDCEIHVRSDKLTKPQSTRLLSVMSVMSSRRMYQIQDDVNCGPLLAILLLSTLIFSP